MKKTLLSLVLLFGLAVNASAQGIAACLTMEQQQAAYNRSLAAKIIVTSTYTQQLQCHYNQLATYWQQTHTFNQQKAKDEQQRSKDLQQAQKDAQQIAADSALAARLAALEDPTQQYDELLAFIEVLMPMLGDCSTDVKNELARIHHNRSGHMDGTNPGGQTHNINGFDNPGFIHSR